MFSSSIKWLILNTAFRMILNNVALFLVRHCNTNLKFVIKASNQSFSQFGTSIVLYVWRDTHSSPHLKDDETYELIIWNIGSCYFLQMSQRKRFTKFNIIKFIGYQKRNYNIYKFPGPTRFILDVLKVVLNFSLIFNSAIRKWYE